MKIIIYGDNETTSRIRAALLRKQVEVLVATRRLEDVFSQDEQDGLALAIIDDSIPEAQQIYESVKNQWDIPVVLVLGEGDREWQRLAGWDVEGYISRVSKQTELVARLEAILRRLSQTGTATGAERKK